MVKFISNGKSQHLPKGQEFEVTEQMYELFVAKGYVDGKEAPKKVAVKKVKTESK
jgi:hypothetical protein